MKLSLKAITAQTGRQLAAAQQVAADTKWTDWKGLPGHDKFHAYLRQEADFKATPVVKGRKAKGDVGPALAAVIATLFVLLTQQRVD